MTYVKKVKIFHSDDSNTLEDDANAFLAREIEAGFSCMVYYSEPVEE